MGWDGPLPRPSSYSPVSTVRGSPAPIRSLATVNPPPWSTDTDVAALPRHSHHGFTMGQSRNHSPAPSTISVLQSYTTRANSTRYHHDHPDVGQTPRDVSGKIMIVPFNPDVEGSIAGSPPSSDENEPSVALPQSAVKFGPATNDYQRSRCQRSFVGVFCFSRLNLNVQSQCDHQHDDQCPSSQVEFEKSAELVWETSWEKRIGSNECDQFQKHSIETGRPPS